MKFTGIVAALAVSGAATAAAIPRDQTVDATLESTLGQLNNVLGGVEGALGGIVSGLTGPVDLTDVQSELTAIKSQLTSIVGDAVKRDVISDTINTVTGTVGQVAGPVVNDAENVAGKVVGTVESAAAPVISPVTQVAGQVVGPVLDTVAGATGIVKRDVTALLPLAQQIVSDIQGNVATANLVQDINSLTHQLSISINLPLSLPALSN